MFRFLTLIAFLTGALLLTQGTAQAQDQDLPVAGPDEIIFVGEAPAPPGTEITAVYVQLRPPDVVVCGTAILDERSRFTLVIDASCADGAVGPQICWGDFREGDVCQSLSGDEFMVALPRDGQTIDAGLLEGSERPDFADVVPPHGDSGPSVALPAAGSDQALADRFQSDAPLWLGLALLTAALVAGVGSLVLRRRA